MPVGVWWCWCWWVCDGGGGVDYRCWCQWVCGGADVGGYVVVVVVVLIIGVGACFMDQESPFIRSTSYKRFVS